MKVNLVLILLVLTLSNPLAETKDYSAYHASIVRAEELVSNRQFEEALEIYTRTFQLFDFIFLRDCQVATQVAWYTGNEAKTFDFLRLGIAHGWEINNIRKHTFLKAIQQKPAWKLIENQYDSIRDRYIQRLNDDLRAEVRKMFTKDQKLAIGALFRFSSQAQDRYAERKFAPNSLKQLIRLDQILDQYGYPGEKLVGNALWMSTILSHSNSISKAYVEKDTMYQYLRPKLMLALSRGEISPYEIAIIDNWKISVEDGGKSYGYLDYSITEEELVHANRLRSQLGLRSIETRNRLIDLQQTGINFYLPDRPKSNTKIAIIQAGES